MPIIHLRYQNQRQLAGIAAAEHQLMYLDEQKAAIYQQEVNTYRGTCRAHL
jgi:hypothetical protein